MIAKKLKNQYMGSPPRQLALFIYAYGRDMMWREILSKMPIYYMNTDSALIDSSNLHLLEHIIGPNPGQLKVEPGFELCSNLDSMKCSLLVRICYKDG